MQAPTSKQLFDAMKTGSSSSPAQIRAELELFAKNGQHLKVCSIFIFEPRQEALYLFCHVRLTVPCTSAGKTV